MFLNKQKLNLNSAFFFALYGLLIRPLLDYVNKMWYDICTLNYTLKIFLAVIIIFMIARNFTTLFY